MARFRKRRRLDLGRYVPAAALPEPSLDDLVEEGVLIASAAVRLAIKNLLIVRSVRDKLDFDRDRYVAAVREELANLALEKDADADRLARTRAEALERRGRPAHHSDYRSVDASALRRREEVSRALAARLRDLADEEQWASDVVDRARESALDDVAASVPRPVTVDADYADRREERLRALAEDLVMLQVTPPELRED